MSRSAQIRCVWLHHLLVLAIGSVVVEILGLSASGACLYVLDLEALVARLFGCGDAHVKHFLQQLPLFQVCLVLVLSQWHPLF
jgi:hypothetical protein